jgi:hypothetical protein
LRVWVFDLWHKYLRHQRSKELIPSQPGIGGYNEDCPQMKAISRTNIDQRHLFAEGREFLALCFGAPVD